MHFFRDAQHRLHMVPDFMGDDVSLGKISRGVMTVFQVLIEAQIDIHLFIGGAVKRSHGRLS